MKRRNFLKKGALATSATTIAAGANVAMGSARKKKKTDFAHTNSERRAGQWETKNIRKDRQGSGKSA